MRQLERLSRDVRFRNLVSQGSVAGNMTSEMKKWDKVQNETTSIQMRLKFWFLIIVEK